MFGGKRAASLVLVAGVVALGACGESGADKHVRVTRMAIAASGDAAEIGWNQQGVFAARRVAAGARAKLAVAQHVGAADARSQLERLSRSGAQLVIAHGRAPRYAAAAVAVAASTHVAELVFGSPARTRAGLVGDVEVASQEGGYLAGYIAARASYVRDVGIVVASDDPNWYRTAGGFIAGARRFDAHVKIAYARVGPASDDDVAASQLAAARLIRHGAQMVLGLGERSTLGVMRATLAALEAVGQPKFDAMLIDVVGDKAGADHRSITGLTAVKWNFEPAYRQALADLRSGTFGRHPYTLDLANGGVSVIHEGRTPNDTYEAALKLGKQIERGQIRVPVTTTDAQVRRLLAERPTA